MNSSGAKGKPRACLVARGIPKMAHTSLLRESIQREQYSEWLQGFHWDYFVTSTFRSDRHEPYYAIKHVWSEVERCNVARAFLVAEPHQKGDLHIHGILSGSPPGWYPEIKLPWEIEGRLRERFGIAKVRLCRSNDAVAAYCAKYILKQQSRVCDYYEVFGDKLSWQGGKL